MFWKWKVNHLKQVKLHIFCTTVLNSSFYFCSYKTVPSHHKIILVYLKVRIERRWVICIPSDNVRPLILSIQSPPVNQNKMNVLLSQIQNECWAVDVILVFVPHYRPSGQSYFQSRFVWFCVSGWWSSLCLAAALNEITEQMWSFQAKWNAFRMFTNI